MRRADTPIIGEPFVPGKPTTSSLITDGPFRYSRNPSYLGGAMIYAGIASLTDALWVVLLVPAVLLVMQHTGIEREERSLERKRGYSCNTARSSARLFTNRKQVQVTRGQRWCRGTKCKWVQAPFFAAG